MIMRYTNLLFTYLLTYLQKKDLSGTGDGRQDGKNMTGQTNVLKAKL